MVVITLTGASSELVEIYLKTVSKLPIECIELGYLSNTKDENGPFYHLNKHIIIC